MGLVPSHCKDRLHAQSLIIIKNSRNLIRTKPITGKIWNHTQSFILFELSDELPGAFARRAPRSKRDRYKIRVLPDEGIDDAFQIPGRFFGLGRE